MSTQHSGSTSPSSPSSEHQAAPKSGRNRSLLLLGVLVLLLVALWYDYKIARPQVETAYETVGKINEEYNSLPGKKYVTDKDVQQTLNRKPASVIQEGPYHVEVYSYRSGLPIRSHNYYAVYSAGQPLIFLKHYKFELPMEELKVAAFSATGGEGAAATTASEITPDRSDSRPPLEAVSADAPKGSETANDSSPKNSETTEPAATEKSAATEPTATEPAKTTDAPPAETKSPESKEK